MTARLFLYGLTLSGGGYLFNSYCAPQLICAHFAMPSICWKSAVDYLTMFALPSGHATQTARHSQRTRSGHLRAPARPRHVEGFTEAHRLPSSDLGTGQPLPSYSTQ